MFITPIIHLIFNSIKEFLISVSFAFGIDNFGLFGFNWSNNERLYKLKYRMHNAHVLQTVPKSDLLVHQSADGWLPLCEYLNEDVPSIPYPYQNKNASLFREDLHKSILFTQIIKEIKITLSCMVGVAGICAWCYYKYLM